MPKKSNAELHEELVKVYNNFLSFQDVETEIIEHIVKAGQIALMFRKDEISRPKNFYEMVSVLHDRNVRTNCYPARSK